LTEPGGNFWDLDCAVRKHSPIRCCAGQDVTRRFSQKGCPATVTRDQDALEEVEVIKQNKRFLLRNEIQGACGKVFQSVGVKLPQTVRQAEVAA